MQKTPCEIKFQQVNGDEKLDLKSKKLFNNKSEFLGTLFYNEKIIKKVGSLKFITVDGTFGTRPKIKDLSQLLTIMAVVEDKTYKTFKVNNINLN